MQILDEAEQPLQNGTVIGPLSEGQRFTSYCEARGGRPAPIVTWYSNGEKLHSKFRIIITFHYFVDDKVWMERRVYTVQMNTIWSWNGDWQGCSYKIQIHSIKC